MKFKRYLPILLSAIIINLTSCLKDDLSPGTQVNLEDIVDGEITYILNPSGRAPLSAQLNFNSKVPTIVSITVKGEVPVYSTYNSYARKHNDPVVGLYPNTANEVQIVVSDANGSFASTVIQITTGSLYEGLPDITINAKTKGQFNSEMILSDFHMGNTGFFTSYPFAFDENGIIRWCLDLREYKELAWTTQRLKNGNMVFVTTHTIHEVDMLGLDVKITNLGEYHAHHELKELPNGNYIVAVTKPGTTIDKNGMIESIEDFVIEVDRNSGAVIQEWDMREILDVDRIDLTDGGSDWFHMNGIDYSKSDDCLIISGRNQGVVKVNRDNEPIWILAPHKGWGKSGETGTGFETSAYLLTAVSSSGQAFGTEIQDGDNRRTDFDWTWGQHAPVLLENGNLLLFDNGFQRQFTGSEVYSRAVEYNIDESNNTISEVWSYGEERGAECFTNIISNAQYLASSNTMLFSPGFIINGGAGSSKVVEVTYPDNVVVFEATLAHKNLTSSGDPGWGTIDIVYRSSRFSLSP